MSDAPFHVKRADREMLAQLGVSRETLARLESYVALTLRWSPSIRLISQRDETFVWRRHVLDSLQIMPLLRDIAPPAADFGSGGGFPGLALAIALNRPFHLIESDTRKSAFLIEAAQATGAMITVHPKRIEAVTLPPLRLITARGLAPLTTLLALAAPKLAPDGVCFFHKGRNAAAELTAAHHRWQMDVICHPSRTDPSGTILQISGVTRARSLPYPNA